MKKLISLLCAFSFVFLLTASLGSCEKKKDNAKAPQNSAEDTSEAPPVTVELARDGTSQYEIIYPQLARKEDVTAASDFSKAFRNATGVTLKQKDDFLKNGETHDNDKNKILIGKTNYAASKQAYAELMYQEYRVEINEGCLVIAAYTDGGYRAALKWVEENILSHTVDGVLQVSTQIYSDSLVSGYPISSWTIGGISLNQYRIVYADENRREALITLRDRLAERSGCFLEVVSDSDGDPQPYEILFGDTNRPESTEVARPSALHYTLRTVNSKLVVKAGGEHSFIKLTEDLVNILTDGATKITMNDTYALTDNFFDDPHSVSYAKGTDLRLMTANVQANIKGYNVDNPEDFAFERRLEIFLAALDFYNPTVVGLQECCTSWLNGIATYEKIDKWQVVSFQNPNLKSEQVLSDIMFRKDLYNLKDSGMTYYSKYNNGRCRCITWVVLEDKKTGKQFCFVSTHWDGGDGSENTAQQVTELAAFVNNMAKNYPVFTTGDFNRNEYTNEFKRLLMEANSVDSMYAAEKRLNVAGSWHGWGVPTPSAGSCDHITATSAHAKVLSFETIMYNEQIYASDHAWLIADIQFKS